MTIVAKKPHRTAHVPPTLDRTAEVAADRLIDFTRTVRARNAQDNHWNCDDFNLRIRLSGLCFLLSDVTALIAAYITGAILASTYNVLTRNVDFSNFMGAGTTSVAQFVVSLGLGLMAILWLDTKGHYRQRLPFWESLRHFVKVALVGFICGGFIQYALKDSYSRLQLGLFWMLFGFFLLVGRSLTRRILHSRKLWLVNALVIGNKNSARAISRALASETGMGYRVVEMLSPESLENMRGAAAWKQLLMLYEANHIFIALEGSEMEMHQVALRCIARSRVPHSVVPPWRGLPASNLSPHHFMMRDVFFLHNTSRLRMPMLRFYKRSFDIAASVCALTLLSPLFVLVAIMVGRDGGPVLFSQPRVGQDSRLFPCYKFRSMRVDAEEVLQHYLAKDPAAAEEWAKFQKLKNDVRVTPFGRFIRKTSIDELPQLLNVLKGDMSLVGPRPIMPEQSILYGDDFCFYESVRPGITGPWQVSGRSQLTFDERVALESWYARNWNPWTDIAIILKTFPALLKREQAV